MQFATIGLIWYNLIGKICLSNLLAFSDKLCVKNISEIFGISDVTISKTYRKIYPYHKIIMNNTVTELVLKERNKIENVQKTLTEDEEKRIRLVFWFDN